MTTPAPFETWKRRSYADLRLGLFLHYVFFDTQRPYGGGTLGRRHDGPVATSLDELADGLNVEDIAEAAKTMGAEYVIFSTWHANMNLLYPSDVMNRWRPGHSSRRDVITELIRALHSRNIELILYVHPSDGVDFPEADQASLGWLDSPLYTRWHTFIKETFTELTLRYKGQILGYWFDGGTPPQIDGGLDALRQTIRDIDDRIVLIQNEGYNDNRFRRWADECAREFICDPFPVTDLQANAVVTGNWWADGSYLQWTSELAYRYMVLQSSTSGLRGGVAFATGPYTGGCWEPGMRTFFDSIGRYTGERAATIFGTRPSRAFITKPGMTLASQNKVLTAATETPDGRTTYMHVLHVPLERTLRLPLPANGIQFTKASLWQTGAKVAIQHESDALVLTLPDATWWHPLDTVITLE